MPHVRRQVFNLTREIILGWKEAFNLLGAPEQSMVATKFYINVPCADFFRIREFRTSRKVDIEFCQLDYPFLPMASLPGAPIDPHIWTTHGSLQTRITPLLLGPNTPMKLSIAYTGRVPNGMTAGDPMRVVVMFIGTEE